MWRAGVTLLIPSLLPRALQAGTTFTLPAMPMSLIITTTTIKIQVLVFVSTTLYPKMLWGFFIHTPFRRPSKHSLIVGCAIQKNAILKVSKEGDGV
jgi:hypothetical protein